MIRKLTLLLVSALSTALMLGTPAGAVVAPKSCGTTTVAGKRYQIKVDQITCATGKPWARTYLRSGRKPRGYKCTNYRASQTKMKFRCAKGVKTFFAIRR